MSFDLKKIGKSISFGMESISHLVKQTPTKKLFDALDSKNQEKV